VFWQERDRETKRKRDRKTAKQRETMRQRETLFLLDCIRLYLLAVGATEKEMNDIFTEMETMKHLGHHPNVIQFIGCCTIDGQYQVEHAAHFYAREYSILLDCVRTKSSTQQKVSQLVQNCKYLPEILNSTTETIFTRDPKAIWKYS